MIAALVPAKALDEAKTRLAAMLTEDERRCLALTMLGDVLRTLQAVPRLDVIAVVSPDDEVLERARELGAEAILEPSSARGINQALAHAMNVMSPRGVSSLLVVLADVPAVTPGEIESVLDALPADRGAVICPSSAGGTSALAVRPSGAIRFRFGEQSLAAHERECRERAVAAQVLRIEALERDIDEPDGLRWLISHPAETATHRLLAQISIAQRLNTHAR
jgi:2-phospho-L-lactate guanylyltransferase